jgi:hypothetical protein
MISSREHCRQGRSWAGRGDPTATGGLAIGLPGSLAGVLPASLNPAAVTAAADIELKRKPR